MDRNNKKWKRRLLGPLDCLIGLMIIIILRGTFMFRHEIRTLGMLEKIDDNILCSMRYDRDYGFGNFPEIGASTDGELVRFVMGRLLRGLSFEFSIPDPGCSILSAWTKEEDHMFGRNFDLIRSPALIVETAPDHGYGFLPTVNLAFLGFKEDNLPDSLKGKLITPAAPYIPLDGISEKGLTAAVLRIADEPMNQDAGKMDVIATTAIRLTLNETATVNEAVELSEQCDTRPSTGNCYHSQTADAGGNNTMVECVNNELAALRAEQNYQTAVNLLLPDKKYSFEDSQDRYEILEIPLDSCNGVVENEQVGMDLLQAASKDWHVSESSGRMNATQWSIVFNRMDLTIKVVAGRQYDKPAHKFSLDQWRPVAESSDGAGSPLLFFGSSSV